MCGSIAYEFAEGGPILPAAKTYKLRTEDDSGPGPMQAGETICVEKHLV